MFLRHSAFLRPWARGTALFVLTSLALAGVAAADGSVEVSGLVRDETGRPVAAVSLAPVDGGPGTETDSAGAFRLNLRPGPHTLRVTAAGRAPASVQVEATAASAPLEITLGPLRLQEDVVVQAIRADARAPVTKTDLGREDIERLDYGQEMPILLKQTPSITQYSETGIGAGYAYFYLRGIQQTRVNMTLDGVPLNEAEDSTLYFVDFDGLAGSLDSIQVQRGVGTSSVGSASFAGSVNFESVGLSDRRELQALVSGGSFGTYRTEVGGQTGRVGPGLAFYARASFGETDGFREHSGVDQHTVFFGARRQGDRSTFRLFGFSGREKTELAFLAVDKDTLESDLRGEPALPRGTRPLRPGLRASAMDDDAVADVHPGPAGLLQRGAGLLPPPGRSGGGAALAIQPRLALRGRVPHLQSRERGPGHHRGRSRQRVREPSLARDRGRRFALRKPGFQARDERLRQDPLRPWRLAPLRGCPGAPRGLPVRRGPGHRVGGLDLLQPEARSPLCPAPVPERLRLARAYDA